MSLLLEKVKTIWYYFNVRKVKGVKSMLKINKNNLNLLDTYLTERVVISSKPISNKLLRG